MKKTCMYSILHFMMDLLCAFYMFRIVEGTDFWYTGILIYNFLAFAGQMPLGLVADKLNKNRIITAAGFLSVAVGFLYTAIPEITNTEMVYIGIVFIGIGNAMFHVGGGLEILNESDTGNMKGSSKLGIFVSPGAFGLYIGTIAGKSIGLYNSIYLSTGLAVMISISIFIFILHIKVPDTKNREFSIVFSDYNSNNEYKVTSRKKMMLLLSLVCLFIVVVLRSYLGMIQDFPWKADFGLMLVCAVVLGKAAGGIASDLFGVKSTVLISLSMAAILFIFSEYAICGVLAVFFFQMTMPVTLKAEAVIFRNAKGFAFGLLTFALFIGFLIWYLDIGTDQVNNVSYAGISFVSLVLLMIGVKEGVNEKVI